MPEILSALWALFVIAAVLALAYAFTRYVAGRIPAVRRGKHITILEQVSIGKDQKLLLVKLGKNIYLLGLSLIHV